jgi:hypothetical protein
MYKTQGNARQGIARTVAEVQQHDFHARDKPLHLAASAASKQALHDVVAVCVLQHQFKLACLLYFLEHIPKQIC